MDPEASSNLCVVCSVSPVQVRAVECGHACMCGPCCAKVVNQKRTCPLCRTMMLFPVCGLVDSPAPSETEISIALAVAKKAIAGDPSSALSIYQALVSAAKLFVGKSAPRWAQVLASACQAIRPARDPATTLASLVEDGVLTELEASAASGRAQAFRAQLSAASPMMTDTLEAARLAVTPEGRASALMAYFSARRLRQDDAVQLDPLALEQAFDTLSRFQDSLTAQYVACGAISRLASFITRPAVPPEGARALVFALRAACGRRDASVVACGALRACAVGAKECILLLEAGAAEAVLDVIDQSTDNIRVAVNGTTALYALAAYGFPQDEALLSRAFQTLREASSRHPEALASSSAFLCRAVTSERGAGFALQEGMLPLLLRSLRISFSPEVLAGSAAALEKFLRVSWLQDARRSEARATVEDALLRVGGRRPFLAKALEILSSSKGERPHAVSRETLNLVAKAIRQAVEEGDEEGLQRYLSFFQGVYRNRSAKARAEHLLSVGEVIGMNVSDGTYILALKALFEGLHRVEGARQFLGGQCEISAALKALKWKRGDCMKVQRLIERITLIGGA